MLVSRMDMLLEWVLDNWKVLMMEQKLMVTKLG